MNLIPNKEFEFENEWIIESLSEFDSINFPNVLLIKKKINPSITSKYYLFDTKKNKEIYTFPKENHIFSNSFTSPSNLINYNSNTQILTYMTINITNITNINKLYFEQFKLSYNEFIFNIETLNNMEIQYDNRSSYQLSLLPNSSVMVLFSGGVYETMPPNKLVIFDFTNLEIIMEYSNKYMHYNHLKINNILFISDKNELIIYDYNNHRELKTITNKYTINPYGHQKDISIQKLDKYYIIKDGKSTLFYTFINEDDIPNENKCSICFSKTDKKNIIVPCGHTQFCETCIKGRFDHCPICRSKVEKVIKIFN